MALQVLTVNYKDGIYRVIDGQHRIDFLKQKGRKTAPCLIYKDKTIEEEAEAFVSIQNNHYRMTAIQTFQRKLLYNDPDAIAIKNIVESLGLSISKNARGGKGTSKCKEISAIGVVQNIYKDGGEDVLYNALNFVTTLWGDEKNALQGNVIRGASVFYAKYKSLINIEIVMKELKTIPLVSIMKQANLFKETRSYAINKSDGHSSYNIASAILFAYNAKKRGKNKLPDLFSA